MTCMAGPGETRPTAGRVRRLGWAGLALATVLVGCPEPTQTTTPVPAGERGPGQILYLTYCQSCHGISGRGDGPAVISLRTPPADLTRLWESYGTPLDRDRLVEYIDGRWLLDVHGYREMPIWGNEFFDDSPPQTPNLERSKHQLFEVLANYLETLQTERQL